MIGFWQLAALALVLTTGGLLAGAGEISVGVVARLRAREVGQQVLAADVVGIVDYDFDEQGPAVFEILFDSGVFADSARTKNPNT